MGPVQAGTPSYAAAPARTSGKAIAALVLGIAAVLTCVWVIPPFVLGVVGLVLGFVARSEIGREGAGGAKMATAGIATSVAGMVLAVVWVVIANTLL